MRLRVGVRVRVRVMVRVRVRVRVRAGYACHGLLARTLLLDPCGGEEGLKLLEAHLSTVGVGLRFGQGRD